MFRHVFALDDVFGCILSLFMGAANQPLPTDEEVIVCDENTTAEEVCTFVFYFRFQPYEKRDFTSVIVLNIPYTINMVLPVTVEVVLVA